MTGLLVNIDVDDIDKAVAFYRDGLGLTVGRRFGTDFVEMLGSTSPIYLLKKVAGSAPFKGGAARHYRRHWTPVHLDFAVTDIKAALVRARNAGATLEADIRTAKWGHIALLADPFGNGFCLLEFTGRGYDELLD
jgi:predicted enzyme related to lactoylglutathione lyase